MTTNTTTKMLDIMTHRKKVVTNAKMYMAQVSHSLAQVSPK